MSDLLSISMMPNLDLELDWEQALVRYCRDVHKEVFLCFIDYDKVFYRGQNSKLIVRRNDVGKKDFSCIQNLYWHQTLMIEF